MSCIIRQTPKGHSPVILSSPDSGAAESSAGASFRHQARAGIADAGGVGPDLMLKAANTLARLVPFERKAFNLDYELDVRDLSDEQIIRLLEQSR